MTPRITKKKPTNTSNTQIGSGILSKIKHGIKRIRAYPKKLIPKFLRKRYQAGTDLYLEKLSATTHIDVDAFQSMVDNKLKYILEINSFLGDIAQTYLYYIIRKTLEDAYDISTGNQIQEFMGFFKHIPDMADEETLVRFVSGGVVKDSLNSKIYKCINSIISNLFIIVNKYNGTFGEGGLAQYVSNMTVVVPILKQLWSLATVGGKLFGETASHKIFCNIAQFRTLTFIFMIYQNCVEEHLQYLKYYSSTTNTEQARIGDKPRKDLIANIKIEADKLEKEYNDAMSETTDGGYIKVLKATPNDSYEHPYIYDIDSFKTENKPVIKFIVSLLGKEFKEDFLIQCRQYIDLLIQRISDPYRAKYDSEYKDGADVEPDDLVDEEFHADITELYYSKKSQETYLLLYILSIIRVKLDNQQKVDNTILQSIVYSIIYRDQGFYNEEGTADKYCDLPIYIKDMIYYEWKRAKADASYLIKFETMLAFRSANQDNLDKAKMIITMPILQSMFYHRNLKGGENKIQLTRRNNIHHTILYIHEKLEDIASKLDGYIGNIALLLDVMNNTVLLVNTYALIFKNAITGSRGLSDIYEYNGDEKDDDGNVITITDKIKDALDAAFDSNVIANSNCLLTMLLLKSEYVDITGLQFTGLYRNIVGILKSLALNMMNLDHHQNASLLSMMNDYCVFMMKQVNKAAVFETTFNFVKTEIRNEQLQQQQKQPLPVPIDPEQMLATYQLIYSQQYMTFCTIDMLNLANIMLYFVANTQQKEFGDMARTFDKKIDDILKNPKVAKEVKFIFAKTTKEATPVAAVVAPAAPAAPAPSLYILDDFDNDKIVEKLKTIEITEEESIVLDQDKKIELETNHYEATSEIKANKDEETKEKAEQEAEEKKIKERCQRDYDSIIKQMEGVITRIGKYKDIDKLIHLVDKLVLGNFRTNPANATTTDIEILDLNYLTLKINSKYVEYSTPAKRDAITHESESMIAMLLYNLVALNNIEIIIKSRSALIISSYESCLEETAFELDNIKESCNTILESLVNTLSNILKLNVSSITIGNKFFFCNLYDIKLYSTRFGLAKRNCILNNTKNYLGNYNVFSNDEASKHVNKLVQLYLMLNAIKLRKRDIYRDTFLKNAIFQHIQRNLLTIFINYFKKIKQLNLLTQNQTIELYSVELDEARVNDANPDNFVIEINPNLEALVLLACLHQEMDPVEINKGVDLFNPRLYAIYYNFKKLNYDPETIQKQQLYFLHLRFSEMVASYIEHFNDGIIGKIVGGLGIFNAVLGNFKINDLLAKADILKEIGDIITTTTTTTTDPKLSIEVATGLGKFVLATPSADVNAITAEGKRLIAHEKMKMYFKLMYNVFKNSLTESQKADEYIKHLFAVIETCLSYPIYVETFDKLIKNIEQTLKEPKDFKVVNAGCVKFIQMPAYPATLHEDAKIPNLGQFTKLITTIKNNTLFNNLLIYFRHLKDFSVIINTLPVLNPTNPFSSPLSTLKSRLTSLISIIHSNPIFPNADITDYKNKLTEISQLLTDLNKPDVKYSDIESKYTELTTKLGELETLKNSILTKLNEHKSELYIVCKLAYRYNDGATGAPQNTNNFDTTVMDFDGNLQPGAPAAAAGAYYPEIFRIYGELNNYINLLNEILTTPTGTRTGTRTGRVLPTPTKPTKPTLQQLANSINILTSYLTKEIETARGLFDIYKTYVLHEKSTHTIPPEHVVALDAHGDATTSLQEFKNKYTTPDLITIVPLTTLKLSVIQKDPSDYKNKNIVSEWRPTLAFENERDLLDPDKIEHIYSLASPFEVSEFSNLFLEHSEEFDLHNGNKASPIMAGGGFEYINLEEPKTYEATLEMKLRIHGNISDNIIKLWHKLQRIGASIDNDIDNFKYSATNPDLFNIVLINLQRIHKLLNDQIETFLFLLDKDTSHIQLIKDDTKKKEYMEYLFQYRANAEQLLGYYYTKYTELHGFARANIPHIGAIRGGSRGNRVAKKYHQRKTRRIHENKAMLEIKNIYNSRRYFKNTRSKSKKLKAHSK